jgi:hypothetical protein
MSSNGVVGSATSAAVIDDVLSNLFADETEVSYVFGDQPMAESSSALFAVLSDQKRRKNTATNSIKSRNPIVKKSSWHGSCASFIGSSNELLNLSSLSDDFDESNTLSSLQVKTTTLLRIVETTQLQERYKKTATNTDSLPPKGAKRVIHDSSPHNMSTFGSESVTDSSDWKLIRPEEGDEDDDDEFTEIITENPYEKTVYISEQRLLTTDKILTTSNAFEDNFDKMSGGNSKSINESIKKPRRKSMSCLFEIGQRFDSSHLPSTLLQRVKLTSSFSAEDEAPKCPIRRPSPMRPSQQ